MLISRLPASLSTKGLTLTPPEVPTTRPAKPQSALLDGLATYACANYSWNEVRTQIT